MLPQLIRIIMLMVAPCLIASATIHVSSTPGDAREAEELMARATVLFDAGKYFDAIPVAERALSIRERLLGPEHPDTATSLNYLGRIHRFAGNYSKAESLLTRALAIREKSFGPDHVDVARSLVNLGAVYHVAVDIDRAEIMYERAVKIFEKNLGPEHIETLQVRNNIALVYQERGQWQSAIELNKKILAIRTRVLGTEHLDTAESFANLGALYLDIGQFRVAEEQLLRALAIRRQKLGEEHPSVGAALQQLAQTYICIGSFSKAEPLAEKSASILERSLGVENIYAAAALATLAHLYAQTGAYDRAGDLLRRALAVNQKVLGDHAMTVSLIVDLGELSMKQGDYEDARRHLEKAVAIRERIYQPDHPLLANAVHLLADAYLGLGEYGIAEVLYKRALAGKEGTLTTRYPFTIDAIQQLGNFYLRLGEPSRAEPLLRRSLVLREQVLGPTHLDTAATLIDLGLLNWGFGSPARALQDFVRANKIEAKNNSTFLESGSMTTKQAYIRARTNDIYKFVSYSLFDPSPNAAALGLDSVLNFKAQALDMMADSLSRVRHDARDRMLLDRLAQIAHEISTLTYRGFTSLSNYGKRIKDLLAEQEKLEREISSHSAEFRGQVVPVSVAEVVQAIPPGAALIEWFRYAPIDPKHMRADSQKVKSRYVAYVVKRDSSSKAVDIGDATIIDTSINEFRAATNDPKNKEYRQQATKLYDLLLKPIMRYIENADHLFICPDGSLNLVSIEALVDGRGDYLNNRFEISYLTSGRDLLRTDDADATRDSAPVVVANPNYGAASSTYRLTKLAQRSSELDRGGLVFRPLTNTQSEAQDLLKILSLKPRSLYLRDDATEANLRKLHGPRILHVASHGFFLSDEELNTEIAKVSTIALNQMRENALLRSGIALSGANLRRSGDSDDGILTALEASQLDLHGTELVVLSACDTGIGEIQNGEGVYGLRRALVLAGAQTQVTSLWKVSDEATRKLMVDFYERLMKGEGRSAALRHAQQDMQSSSEYAHPYYWASFVPIGDWRPLREVREASTVLAGK